MTPEAAARFVNELTFHPHWRLVAGDFGGEVRVMCLIRTYNSSTPRRDGSYDDSPATIGPGFDFRPGPNWTEDDVMFEVLMGIRDVNDHEAREFLRTYRNGRWVAPFHPHNEDGKLRWARKMLEWARRPGRLRERELV